MGNQSKTKDVTLICSPTVFPKNVSHEKHLEELSENHDLVILFSFGDEEYDLSKDYLLPYNVYIIEYDFDSIDQTLREVRELLSMYDISMISRHDVKQNLMLPFLMTGSILTIPSSVSLSVLGEARKKRLVSEPLLD